MKKARVLVTYDCNRKCKYCCNNYSKIMQNIKTINNIKDLEEYDEILITGGEPFLDIVKTHHILWHLSLQNPTTKLYLYTAYLPLDLNALMSVLCLVDGIHFTLHANSGQKELSDFLDLQKFIHKNINYLPNTSFRCHIHPKILPYVKIDNTLWIKIDTHDWYSEEELLSKTPNGLPVDEELFYLEYKM